MEIKYQITAADYAEANSRGLRLVQAIGAVLIVVGVVNAVIPPHSAVPAVPVMLIGLFLLFGWRLTVARAYKADKRLRQELSAKIDEQGIDIQAESSKGELSWRAFTGQVETKNLFLLYQSPRMFNLFPKRAFSAAEAEAFRALVKQNVPPMPRSLPRAVKSTIFWFVIALAAVLLWHVIKDVR